MHLLHSLRIKPRGVIGGVLATGYLLCWLPRDLLKTSKAPLQDFANDMRRSGAIDVAIWQIPHDDKKDKGGEDTYFISKDGYSFGVFDGVGGWITQGVDPREYSYRLSQGCKNTVDEKGITDPLEILKEGCEQAKGVTGSSTACVATIRKDSDQATVANLGDSGFLVIRGPDAIYTSKEQLFKFNFPYQVGSNNRSLPTDADVTSHTLQPKDVIVMATDGVLDNLFSIEITKIVTQNSDKTAQSIAKGIADQAYLLSKDKQATVPFTVNAQIAGVIREVGYGGKEDDITVLVAKYKSSLDDRP